MKRVADLHFHHGPASDYQALAKWPAALDVITQDTLKPVVRGAEYDQKSRDLVAHARELVRGLPGQAGVSRLELLEHCSPSEIAGITGLLFMYQRFIADISISMIHIAENLDGAEEAGKSHFPI